MITANLEMLNMHFKVARHNGSMTDVARSQILFSVQKFSREGGRRPSFAATIDFRCSNTSRDIGLENVRLTFGIFHLSFTLMELLLLPVCGGYLLSMFQYVAWRLSYFHCVRRPHKCMLNVWNFSATPVSLAVRSLLLLPVGSGHI
jgi:hypothetical protein